jgi:hypothetical protein
MSPSKTLRPLRLAALCGSVAIAAAGSIGCQSDIGGQTLPSPFYMVDDVQYFPAGPEFKLTREAAALKAYRLEQEQSQLQQPAVSRRPPASPMARR